MYIGLDVHRVWMHIVLDAHSFGFAPVKVTGFRNNRFPLLDWARCRNEPLGFWADHFLLCRISRTVGSQNVGVVGML